MCFKRKTIKLVQIKTRLDISLWQICEISEAHECLAGIKPLRNRIFDHIQPIVAMAYSETMLIRFGVL